ncbi:MAG: hypothetical protein A2252_07425 [Elusimicrobia bacterium RIFOXYA2_FULL_39_19]|nr:MAG: hypothetical protein A2252_07425 [Elusimicrobia bacterium RIFOXYA2_FULL_39_19]
MNISVIICSTVNRTEDLKKCIDSLLNADSSREIEIIVVCDNQFNKIISEIADKYKEKIKIINAINKGLSIKRNKGIREARNEIVAFLDDDVIVDNRWIHKMSEAYKEKNVGFAGGKIIPEFEQDIPKWLEEDIFVLGGFNYYEKGNKINETRKIIGCNMSVKKEVFNRIGYFNEDFGRGAKKYSSGEEQELFQRIRKMTGYQSFYKHDAIVTHKIQKERINKEYIKERYYELGYCNGGITLLNSKVSVLKTYTKLLFSFICYILNNSLRNYTAVNYNRGLLKAVTEDN